MRWPRSRQQPIDLEPRTAPEPETADQRSERLSRRRRFTVLGALGAIVLIAWQIFEMFGPGGFARENSVGVVLVIIVGGVLWALAEERWGSDDDDD